MAATNCQEIGREGQAALSAGDGDDFIFHGLAEHFHHVSPELGEFIQKYTPLCAREISPGWGQLPPPTKPAWVIRAVANETAWHG